MRISTFIRRWAGSRPYRTESTPSRPADLLRWNDTPMAERKSSAWVRLGMLIAGLVSIGTGLVWFLMPSVTVLQTCFGSMSLYPNWRGLPFAVLPTVVWIIAAIVPRHQQIGSLKVTVSVALLIAGFCWIIAGLAWLYTPVVTCSGDSVGIGYPNPAGLPLLALAGAFLGVDCLLLWREDRAGRRVVISVVLMIGGPVALIIGLVALALVASLTQGLFFLYAYNYEQVVAFIVWIIAALVLVPDLVREGLIHPIRVRD